MILENRFLNKKILLILTIVFFSFFLKTNLSYATTYGSNFFTTSSPCEATNNNNSCSLAIDGVFDYPGRFDALALPITLTIDAGTSTVLGKWGISPYNYNNGDAFFVKDITLAGSNDNSNFTELDSRTVPSGGYSNGSIQFEYILATTTELQAYRYYKLTGTNSYTDPQWYLNEIEAYACLSDCGVTGGGQATTTYYTTFMSGQTDFVLQLLMEAGFVILGMLSAWWFTKKLSKR